MLDWLAERRIRESINRGELDNLPGAFKPLPADPIDPLVPAHIRAAMRIVHNVGGTPLEIVLRRELAQTDRMLADEIQKINTANSGDRSPVVARLRERRLNLLLQLKAGY